MHIALKGPGSPKLRHSIHSEWEEGSGGWETDRRCGFEEQIGDFVYRQRKWQWTAHKNILEWVMQAGGASLGLNHAKLMSCGLGPIADIDWSSGSFWIKVGWKWNGEWVLKWDLVFLLLISYAKPVNYFASLDLFFPRGKLLSRWEST